MGQDKRAGGILDGPTQDGFRWRNVRDPIGLVAPVEIADPVVRDVQAGYERAWGTILDSNITTLIAGIALFLFGSGPVRGFAVVHCIGIMTSMFSAVFVSRGIVAVVYGGRKKLDRISIGQIWRPAAAPAGPSKG